MRIFIFCIVIGCVTIGARSIGSAGGGGAEKEKLQFNHKKFLPACDGGLLVDHQGSSVCYNTKMKVPFWSIHCLDGEKKLRDPNRFEVNAEDQVWRLDPIIPASMQIGLDDYKSRYFRLQSLISEIDFSSGNKVSNETYLLSNAAPMHKGLKQLWKRFEAYVRVFANDRTLWVITGVICGGNKKNHKTVSRMQEKGVCIPAYWYKIIYDGSSNGGSASFLFENKDFEPEGIEAFDKFHVSIDLIEEMSGFNFLSHLPEDAQEEIESESLQYWYLGPPYDNAL